MSIHISKYTHPARRHSANFENSVLLAYVLAQFGSSAAQRLPPRKFTPTLANTLRAIRNEDFKLQTLKMQVVPAALKYSNSHLHVENPKESNSEQLFCLSTRKEL
jgi:hypothetical protein